MNDDDRAKTQAGASRMSEGMPEQSPDQHAFDVESAEHLLFLGAVIAILTDGDTTGGAPTVTQIDALPGYENNLHTHPPNELFYVLDGEMTLYVNREPYHLTDGMSGFVPENTPHGFRFSGGSPLRVLAVFAPAGMAEFFRDVGTPVDSREIPEYHGPTQADLERMMAASEKYDMQRLGPLPPAT